MSTLVLNSERIYLKNLIDTVSPEIIQQYLNDKEQSKFMFNVPFPYELEDAHKFFKYLNYINNHGNSYELGIFNNKDNSFIGVISLADISLENQNAEIGYWIAKKYWRKGYATEAAMLVVEYAFEEFNLNRIYANLQKENIASLTLLTRLGFQVEGLQRKHVKNKGVLVDRYICGLLREEFK